MPARSILAPVLCLAALIPSQSALLAQPTSGGRLGATSRSSIGIAVSVRPRVRIQIADNANATMALHPARSTAGRICLESNMAQGSYTLSLQASNARPGMASPVPVVASKTEGGCVPRAALEHAMAMLPADLEGAPFESAPVLIVAPE